MNWEYFTKDFNLATIWSVLIGTIVIYIILIAFTRIFGLKSFSKMTGFDFINTIAIGNLFGMSISTGNPKLLMGIVIIGLLYLMNYFISLIQFKSPKAQDVLDNSPILLMKNGELIQENLEKCRVTVDEIRGKLREANVLQLDHVHAVVLETTGDVSVLHGSPDTPVDDFVMKDVMSNPS